MTTLELQRAEDVVAGWRSGVEPVDGLDNPAGPLYPSSDDAEQEITMTGGSGRCGTACTVSIKVRYCC
jgi:hypothetical protein